MNLGMFTRVLWRRRQLRTHERWTRAELADHQRVQLARLRAFAQARSPFYARTYADLSSRPLDQLPVLTKATLMDNFDDIVTDRSVRLRDANRYLTTTGDDELLNGKYWVSSTSGSSGRKSVVPTDAREWAAMIATYARANEWAGIRAGLTRHVKIAVVSSTAPWHQSSRVAATLQSPFVRTQRFDAGSSLSGIVRGLNEMQPEVLVAYASMTRILAEEQLAGRLRIHPRGVNCSSEVLTGEARAVAERAFGVRMFNVYAATETGGVAAECDRHEGMHLFEDSLIVEVVDEMNRPVSDGDAGAKLLVTVLASRTLPLIRYELTDRVKLSTKACSCGRPFRLVEAIEGRTDDALHIAAQDGRAVEVHPLVFHRVLDELPLAAWQVRRTRTGLRVLLARPRGDLDRAALIEALRSSVARTGAVLGEIEIEIVDDIVAGAAGKRPMIVATPDQ
jgi:phenylacetate-CoA ligase